MNAFKEVNAISTKTLIMIIVLFFVIAFLLSQYKDSYKTINEALSGKEFSLESMQIKQIIGGSEYGNKAFYFFLSTDNHVVGVTLEKGLFGWRHRASTTGTGLELDIEQKLSKLSNHSSNEKNKFYYGLTSYENIGHIVVSDKSYATLIKLDDIITDGTDVKNTYLWYTFLEDNHDRSTIKVYDRKNNLIDSQ